MSDQIVWAGRRLAAQKYRVEAEPDPAALVGGTIREMSEPTDGMAPSFQFGCCSSFLYLPDGADITSHETPLGFVATSTTSIS